MTEADAAVRDEPHCWDMPATAFDAWLRAQSADIQEMCLLDQIDTYAAARGEMSDGE